MKQGTFTGRICSNIVTWNDGAADHTGETVIYVKGNCSATITVDADNNVSVTRVLNGVTAWAVSNIKTVERVA